MVEEPEHHVEVDPATSLDKSARSELKGKHGEYDASRRRRDAFVQHIRDGLSIREACDAVEVKHDTYKKWRQRWPQFAHQVDAVRISDPSKLKVGWKKGFADFRLAYYGMASPWFHLEVVDTFENSPPGTITLILLPPEHGKTTLLEDFLGYKYATQPDYRALYGSEKVDHCIKVGQRIKNRMEDDGPVPEYVKTFGPFVPQTGEDRVGDRKSTQPWGEKRWSIFKKGSSDERDYSFAAVGITAAVAGTRCDDLYIDDVQSLRTLGLTPKIIEVLRQDWFSRPGAKGRIYIVGTRVGDDDVYRELLDLTRPDGSPLVDRVIVYPAVRVDPVSGETIYLWPERYSPEEYERMEGNVGPDAWARNYQQKPTGAGGMTFSLDVLDASLDPLRSYSSVMPSWVKELALSIDPALGGQNAITVQGWGDEKMIVLDTSGLWGLTRVEQILTEANNLLALWQNRKRDDGLEVAFSTVVIEEMAFQRGLVNDERLIELQRQYGFYVRPHQTGHNKNDVEIGVASMALSFIRGDIVLPAATDAMTDARIRPLVEELLKWRPRVRGTKLKMDRVMALWFGWLLWRQRRGTLAEGGRPTAPKGAGLPFAPMARPLLPKPTLWTPMGAKK